MYLLRTAPQPIYVPSFNKHSHNYAWAQKGPTFANFATIDLDPLYLIKVITGICQQTPQSTLPGWAQANELRALQTQVLCLIFRATLFFLPCHTHSHNCPHEFHKNTYDWIMHFVYGQIQSYYPLTTRNRCSHSGGALVPKHVVNPIQRQQFVMSSTLGNRALVNHKDHVGAHDGGEPARRIQH